MISGTPPTRSPDVGDETCVTCGKVASGHENVLGRLFCYPFTAETSGEDSCATFTRRPASVGDAAEGLQQHFQVIDDALDKVICEQRAQRGTSAAFWSGTENAEAARTRIAVIDAYLELLEAARSALRAALAAP